MRYIQCPNEYSQLALNETVIFMAGGITGCPDWQTQVIESMITKADHRRPPRSDRLVMINPRRENFDITKGSDEAQIEWEHRHIAMSDWVFFWFPKDGKCMITLFELGVMLGSGKKIRIGVEPGYCRELDVREQTKHYAPWLKICSSLEELYEPVM